MNSLAFSADSAQRHFSLDENTLSERDAVGLQSLIVQSGNGAVQEFHAPGVDPLSPAPLGNLGHLAECLLAAHAVTSGNWHATDDVARILSSDLDPKHAAEVAHGRHVIDILDDSRVFEASLRAVLGRALYDQYPWSHFFDKLRMHTSPVWERDHQGFFEASRLYMAPVDWLKLLGALVDPAAPTATVTVAPPAPKKVGKHAKIVRPVQVMESLSFDEPTLKKCAAAEQRPSTAKDESLWVGGRGQFLWASGSVRAIGVVLGPARGFDPTSLIEKLRAQGGQK